uniref:CD9 antigen n=1 Tax=Oncorhynchus mykiss TaxID=8022 RepID=A0A8K9XMG9_ONCMY
MMVIIEYNDNILFIARPHTLSVSRSPPVCLSPLSVSLPTPCLSLSPPPGFSPLSVSLPAPCLSLSPPPGFSPLSVSLPAPCLSLSPPPICLSPHPLSVSRSPSLQFFFFLLLIFGVEVAAGIWGLSNKDTVVEDITEFYKQTYNNYMNTKQEALKETLRLIHFGLNCCGLTGTIIDSARETCPKKEGLEALITTSCPAAIDEVFNSKLHIIGGVGIGIGVLMIFGMIFSMLLCCAIRRSRDIM